MVKKAHKKQVMGIEPTYLAWKASVLPLNYTCISYQYSFVSIGVTGFEPATSWSQTRRSSQAEPHPVATKNIIYDHYCFVNTFSQFFAYVFLTDIMPLSNYVPLHLLCFQYSCNSRITPAYFLTISLSSLTSVMPVSTQQG